MFMIGKMRGAESIVARARLKQHYLKVAQIASFLTLLAITPFNNF